MWCVFTLNVNSLVSESQERIDNIKLSVEKAKEAVSLDVSDGVSWCEYTSWYLLCYYIFHVITLLVTCEESVDST